MSWLMLWPPTAAHQLLPTGQLLLLLFAAPACCHQKLNPLPPTPAQQQQHPHHQRPLKQESLQAQLDTHTADTVHSMRHSRCASTATPQLQDSLNLATSHHLAPVEETLTHRPHVRSHSLLAVSPTHLQDVIGAAATGQQLMGHLEMCLQSLNGPEVSKAERAAAVR